MPASIKFEKRINTIQLISVRNLTKKIRDAIKEEVIQFFASRHVDWPLYVGECFGRHDIILHYVGDSARVLSNEALKLEENINNLLMSQSEIPTGMNATSSLVICRRISHSNHSKDKALDWTAPLRLYSFCKSDMNEPNLKRILEKTSESPANSVLLWNSSGLPLIVITEGKDIVELFDAFYSLLSKSIEEVKRSSTLVTRSLQNFSEKSSSTMLALTALKMKRYADLNLNSVFWTKLDGFGPQLTRFGCFDESLVAKPYSLGELSEHIFSLRDQNRDTIDYTSTELLFPRKDKIDRKKN